MDRFPYQKISSVRFRDTDAMGMAHHAVMLSYLEEARTAYVMELLGLDGIEEIPYTIARVECDYRTPANCGDELVVGVRTSEVGDRSFEMEYRVERADTEELVAEAKTVQVQYDYERETATDLPEDFADRVEAFESEAREP